MLTTPLEPTFASKCVAPIDKEYFQRNQKFPKSAHLYFVFFGISKISIFCQHFQNSQNFWPHVLEFWNCKILKHEVENFGNLGNFGMFGIFGNFPNSKTWGQEFWKFWKFEKFWRFWAVMQFDQRVGEGWRGTDNCYIHVVLCVCSCV